MNAVRVLEVESGASPLEVARTGRSLTREEAAAAAALSVDEIAWLEEGRLYRFRSAHLAVAAVATYAAALGVDHHEALELAGRPVPPRPSKATRPRLVVGAACAVVLLALLTAIVVGPRITGSSGQGPSATLPPTWRVTVDVLNGSGDVNYTRQVADRIGALAYQLGPIRRADTFKYEETAVYYPRHAQALADRLATSLCVGTKPLPGGKDRRRLVVIVGPPSVGGC